MFSIAKMKSVLCLLLFCFAVSSIPLEVSAQTQFVSSNTKLVTNPVYPRPQSSTTVTLEAFSNDLTGAKITWYVDGVAQSSFENARSISILTGNAGENTTVSAVVTYHSGWSETVRTTIAPTVIDLIVEPQTTAPDFYKGKTLPSAGSSVRLVAIPQLFVGNTQLDPENLVYTWSANGKTLFGGPQTGKSDATILMPNAGALTIILTVSTQDGLRKANTSQTIRSEQPHTAFYEDTSLYGIIPLAPTNFIVSKEEITVRAEPYNMSLGSFGNAKRIWELNGRRIDNPSGDPELITLRKNNSTAAANISYSIESLGGSFQYADNSFKISFTGDSFVSN